MRDMNKILAGSIGIVVVIMIVVAIILAGQQSKSITINEFFDDLVDRNGDGKIEMGDAPLDWASYDLWDNITIRDKITNVSYTPANSMYYLQYNETTGEDDKIYTGEEATIICLRYSGEYEIREIIWPTIEFHLQGNYTDVYKEGDYIEINITIDEPTGVSGETYSAKLVD